MLRKHLPVLLMAQLVAGAAESTAKHLCGHSMVRLVGPGSTAVPWLWKPLPSTLPQPLRSQVFQTRMSSPCRYRRRTTTAAPFQRTSRSATTFLGSLGSTDFPNPFILPMRDVPGFTGGSGFDS